MNIIKYIITFITSWLNRKKADDEPKFSPPPAAKVEAPNPPDEGRLVVRYDITQRYHKGWARDLNDITEVCVHHTQSDGTFDGTLAYVSLPEPKRQADYKGAIGLFPFLVGQDGRIAKLGPLSRWWWASDSGAHDKTVVNIELCQGLKEFTDVQTDSLLWLIFDYILFHCPNCRRIVGHDYNNNLYSGTTKGCPGNMFPWSKLEGEMARRNIKFSNHKIGCYEFALEGDGI